MLIDWSVRNCLSCICYLFWTFVRFIFLLKKKTIAIRERAVVADKPFWFWIGLWAYDSIHMLNARTQLDNIFVFCDIFPFQKTPKEKKTKQISDKPNEPRRFHNDRLNLKWAEMHKIFLDQYENRKKNKIK